MTCLMSPCAECNMHWLLEPACACGASGSALASAEPGKKPDTAGATTRATDSPVATALRTAGTIRRISLRATLWILESLRFIDRPPRKSLGAAFLFPRSVIQVTLRRKFTEHFVTEIETASSQPQYRSTKDVIGSYERARRGLPSRAQAAGCALS